MKGRKTGRSPISLNLHLREPIPFLRLRFESYYSTIPFKPITF
jgi:hypothetical protein